MKRRLLVTVVATLAIFMCAWMLNWTTCNMDHFSPETCSVTASGSFRNTLIGFEHLPVYAWMLAKVVGGFFARLWNNLR